MNSFRVTRPVGAKWQLFGLGTRFLLWYPRVVAVTLLLLVLVAGLGLLALSTGSTRLDLTEVLDALAGGAAAPIVRELRLPRVVCALLVGSCLAVAGAVMQSLTRNALGSPDIIGVTTGAALGAVVAIVILGQGPVGTVLGALAGCLAVSSLIYALTYSVRRAPGQRLVLVGIGIGAFCHGLVALVLTHSNPDTAIGAQIWMTGTLTARAWGDAVPPAVAAAVLLPALLVMARHLNALETGDDMASQLGVDVAQVRLLAVVCCVGLTAAAVCSVGPISFVALAAPHLARRLTGTATVPMVPAAACGAALLLGADVLAQRLPEELRVPVGIAAGILGGLYLVFVLTRRSR